MKCWDASAIIPLCLQEPRASLLKKVPDEDEAMAVWWATPVECASAFARLRREGLMQPSDEVKAHYVLHPLRAADALQLAAALVWAHGQPFGQYFICLNRRLREAAHRKGFVISPAPELL